MTNCFAENCTSQKIERPSSGFACIHTNGTIIVERTCMKSNSNGDAVHCAHSLNLLSNEGQIIECSVSFCQGFGTYTSPLRPQGNFILNSINSSYNNCQHAAFSSSFGNTKKIFCISISNSAISRIITMNNGLIDSSNFINNSETNQGLILCELNSTSYIKSCSFVQCKAAYGFYSAYVYNGVTHVIVSNCSLIENSFKSDYIATSPSTIDFSKNERLTFEVFLPMKLDCDNFATLFVYIETNPICSYYQWRIILLLTVFLELS